MMRYKKPTPKNFKFSFLIFCHVYTYFLSWVPYLLHFVVKRINNRRIKQDKMKIKETTKNKTSKSYKIYYCCCLYNLLAIPHYNGIKNSPQNNPYCFSVSSQVLFPFPFRFISNNKCILTPNSTFVRLEYTKIVPEYILINYSCNLIN